MPRRTPPAPDVLRHAESTLRYGLDEFTGQYKEKVPELQQTIRRDLGKLRPLALEVLPERLSALPVFETGELDQEGMKHALGESLRIVREAVLLIDHPQQEKIQPSDEELQEAKALKGTPTEFASIVAGMWDMDFRRIDEMTNEHRYLPEDWRSLGGDYRRVVARKQRTAVAMMMYDKQPTRDQNVIVNAGFHPSFPETMDELLKYMLAETRDCSQTVSAVREGRHWMLNLLTQNGFQAGGTLRNHYRFKDDFEDGYVLRRKR